MCVYVCVCVCLQPSFVMSDQTRAGKASALLAGTLSDLRAMEHKLRGHLDQEIALKEEIPELKKEVRERRSV